MAINKRIIHPLLYMYVTSQLVFKLPCKGYLYLLGISGINSAHVYLVHVLVVFYRKWYLNSIAQVWAPWSVFQHACYGRVFHHYNVVTLALLRRLKSPTAWLFFFFNSLFDRAENVEASCYCNFVWGIYMCSGSTGHIRIPLTTNVFPCRDVIIHDDVINWKHFPRYWPFVRGIHRSPVNSPHKGQWREALMCSLICTWINAWVSNHEAGD